MGFMEEAEQAQRQQAERASAEEARIEELSKQDPAIWCRYRGHEVVELEVPAIRYCRVCLQGWPAS